MKSNLLLSVQADPIGDPKGVPVPYALAVHHGLAAHSPVTNTRFCDLGTGEIPWHV
jgi:hypothetical protein